MMKHSLIPRILSCSLAAIFLCIFAAPPAQGMNLAMNGDFSTTTTGWTVENGSVSHNNGFGGSSPALASQDAGTGILALTGGRIRQDIATMIGDTYEFSFWHNHLDNSGTQADQDITWSVGAIGSELVGPSAFTYTDSTGSNITHGWTQETVTFVANATSTRIAFEGTVSGVGGFWGIQVDGVSVVQIPEPSRAVLLGLGLVAICFRRRRGAVSS